ncbi:Methyl-accepting chemotaxis protein McpU [Neorhizobium galegae bv. officinalis]|uniref:Methyl-accepting chemotaxis protein McpU n=2 Tax=Neorhizobium galegae TaxID=399 RepID=A0A0T7GJR8_NEOGA|nr:Methyl-accepting chemotaxis protein McpU [Neorhizobium galegae bv. officinalis]
MHHTEGRDIARTPKDMTSPISVRSLFPSLSESPPDLSGAGRNFNSMTATPIRKTLSVNHRLWTLAGSAFAGIGAMLLVGWYEGHLVDDALQRATEIREHVDTVNGMRIANLELVLAAMDTIVDRDDKRVDPARLKAMADSIDKLKSASGDLKKLATDIGNPGLVASFEMDLAAVSSAIQIDLRKMVETGAPDDAYDKIDDVIDSAGERLGTALETAGVAGEKLVSNRVQEANMLSSNALYVQLGCGLIALVVMAILQSVHGGAIRRGIDGVRASMQRIIGGDYKTAVPGIDRGDEIGEMARATDMFRLAAVERQTLEISLEDERRRNEAQRQASESEQKAEAQALQFAVDSLASALNRLSEGDLAAALERPFRGNLERLRSDFNRVVERLCHIMTEVANSSSSIGANANQMRSAADDLAKRTEKQAASLEETSAALEEITATVRNATGRAEEATQMVSDAKDYTEKSSGVVRDATAAMGRIEDATAEIGKIINVIDEIAFQTNLLALNAGVEAARAGEAGKGFAVVAQEVRELAGRAAGAAKDIKALVTRSNQEVKTGVDLVKATGDALTRIGDDVLKINDHVHAIFTSAREQSTGLTEINMAIGQMDQATQQNAAMVEQSTAASHSLASDAENLNKLIGHFQIRGGNGPRAVEAASASTPPKPSPALNLMNKLAGAFSNSPTSAKPKAVGSSDKWEEF